MPRKARLEFAGAVYHLLDRGDRREAIFRDDRDRESFLATLGQGVARELFLGHVSNGRHCSGSAAKRAKDDRLNHWLENIG
jgi:hypothetical protein